MERLLPRLPATARHLHPLRSVADADNDGFTKRVGIYRCAVAGDGTFKPSPTSTISRGRRDAGTVQRPAFKVSVAPPDVQPAGGIVAFLIVRTDVNVGIARFLMTVIRRESRRYPRGQR